MGRAKIKIYSHIFIGEEKLHIDEEPGCSQPIPHNETKLTIKQSFFGRPQGSVIGKNGPRILNKKKNLYIFILGLPFKLAFRQSWKFFLFFHKKGW
jgi:hypothetical protein